MTLSDRYRERHNAEAPRYDRLEAVLYRLMRDHVSVGVLTALVEEHGPHSTYTLSIPGLADVARDLAEEIRT